MNIALRKFYLKHKIITLTIVPIVLIAVILALILLTAYIPRTASTDYSVQTALNNSFIRETPFLGIETNDKNAPYDTLMYFQSIFENNNDYRVDMIELNIHITSDDKLVLFSHNTLDDVSDAKTIYGKRNLRPQDTSYEQLKRYNIAYNYMESGTYPYRDSKTDLKLKQILSIEEVFTYLESTVKDTWKSELLYVITIKSSIKTDKAIDILYKTLQSYNILSRVIIHANSNKVASLIDGKYPKLHRTATGGEVFGFYSNFTFGINLSKKTIGFSALLIPDWAFVVNLGKKSIVDYAHKYGISVMYTGIENINSVKHLTKIGADAILTNRPHQGYNSIYLNAY